jgi:hypothetical protein
VIPFLPTIVSGECITVVPYYYNDDIPGDLVVEIPGFGVCPEWVTWDDPTIAEVTVPVTAAVTLLVGGWLLSQIWRQWGG